MKYVIRAVAFADGEACPIAGQFVKSMDVDAYNGRGLVDYTEDASRAKQFETFEAAFAFWQTQSTVRPLRRDGKPNRPLTATTCAIEKIPDGPL